MAVPFGGHIENLDLVPLTLTKPEEPTPMNPFKFTNPEAQTQDGAKSAIDALNNKDMLAKCYYAVEMPFVLNDSIPRDMKTAKSKQGGALAPVKTALNLFDTFGEAEAFAKQVNAPQVILEIKTYATVKPQAASVVKLDKTGS